MQEIKDKLAAQIAKTYKVSEEYIFDRELTAELDELCVNESIDESIFKEYATEVKKLDKEKLMEMVTNETFATMAHYNLEHSPAVEEEEEGMITRSAAYVSELEEQKETWKENHEKKAK